MDGIEDECPICMEMNLALEKGTAMNGVRLTCCGTLICKSCYEAMDKRNEETRTKFTCPICRTPQAESAEENFARCMKHAKEGRGWALGMVANDYYDGNGVAKTIKSI